MANNLPLSMILEVAVQRATNRKQVQYVLNYMAKIEQLEKCYAAQSGQEYSSLVSAVDAYRAIANVQAYDNRICKVTSALPVSLSDFSQN